MFTLGSLAAEYMGIALVSHYISTKMAFNVQALSAEE